MDKIILSCIIVVLFISVSFAGEISSPSWSVQVYPVKVFPCSDKEEIRHLWTSGKICEVYGHEYRYSPYEEKNDKIYRKCVRCGHLQELKPLMASTVQGYVGVSMSDSNRFLGMKFEILTHEDALIAQALGRNCSVYSEEGILEAYQYGDKLYVLEWKETP